MDADAQNKPGSSHPESANEHDERDKPVRVDWKAVVAEQMTREDLVKEDGRYLVSYRFKPGQEA